MQGIQGHAHPDTFEIPDAQCIFGDGSGSNIVIRGNHCLRRKKDKISSEQFY
jgi:hypothetical protein